MSVRTRSSGTALLVAAALALTACGGSSSSDEATSALENTAGSMSDYGVGVQFTATEPLTFSLLYSDNPNYAYDEDWLLWSELSELTNVTFETTVVPASDYEQKRSLLIGAGDAPYIIAKTYPGQEESFVASGAILAVSDYIDLMPNYQAKIEEWGLEDNIDQLRQADGKYYVLPGLHEDAWQDYTIAMRTDVLDELDLASPTSWDEFRSTLEAIKAAYPDSYPFSDRYSDTYPGGSILSIAGTGFGTLAGWSYDNVTWDADAEEFVGTAATDEYKAMVEYFQGLVADGLMDPESFTQDDDTAIQKFVTGQSFAISTNAQSIVNDYEPGLAANDADATVAKIAFPCGDAGCVVSATSRLENGIMISAEAADDPNFVAMMQFIDWLFYSDEGQELAKWGVEGTTYETDEDGTRTLAADVDYVGLNPTGTTHLQEDYGFSGGDFAYGGSTDLLWSTFSDAEITFQESVSDYDLTELSPPAPLDETELEQVALLDTALDDAVSQGTVQFILGQRDMSEWDTFLSELDSTGLSSYVDIVNGARERYVAENG
ncbi:MAG TPA: extracellular solute-binding protein [Cellulomonas sp.]